jgi:alpha 1,3-glucosidase
MRAHAHLDARRREPYLLPEPHLSHARVAISGRYALLPYIYTLFAEAQRSGVPVMRCVRAGGWGVPPPCLLASPYSPLWFEFPEDTTVFTEQSSFLLGRDLLVTPVGTAGATSAHVRFPGPATWVDTHSWSEIVTGPAERTVAAPLERIPVFQRAGSIIPKKLRVRRSSALARNDPFTFYIVLDPATVRSFSFFFFS